MTDCGLQSPFRPAAGRKPPCRSGSASKARPRRDRTRASWSPSRRPHPVSTPDAAHAVTGWVRQAVCSSMSPERAYWRRVAVPLVHGHRRQFPVTASAPRREPHEADADVQEQLRLRVEQPVVGVVNTALPPVLPQPGIDRREGADGLNGSPAPSATPSDCLGVTGIEPTQYGLVFERFINPGRNPRRRRTQPLRPSARRCAEPATSRRSACSCGRCWATGAVAATGCSCASRTAGRP